MLASAKKVKIHIRSTTKDEHGYLPPVEQTYEGSFMEKNGKCYAMYSENAESGFGNTRTTLKWEEDRVLLLRSGALEHSQEFVRGLVQESVYRTPYMEIPLVTTTHYVYCFYRKGVWHLEMEYTLAHGEQPYGDMKLLIDVEGVES